MSATNLRNLAHLVDVPFLAHEALESTDEELFRVGNGALYHATDSKRRRAARLLRRWAHAAEVSP